MSEKKLPIKERRATFFEVCKDFNARFEKSVAIFSIDPGRGNCGWAFYRTRVIFGSIKPEKQRSSFRKVVVVTDKIVGLLEKFKPDIVIIEDYAYGATQGRELSGEIQGCIMYWLVKMNLPLIKPSPSQVKSFINAQSKSKIMMSVLKKYRMTVNNDDEADAFVLAMIGRALFDIVRLVPKSNLENNKIFMREFYKLCKRRNLEKKQADVVFRLLWRKGNHIWL